MLKQIDRPLIAVVVAVVGIVVVALSQNSSLPWDTVWIFCTFVATGTLALYAAFSFNETRKSGARQLRAYVYFHGPDAREWPPVDPDRLSITVNVINGASAWARNITVQRVIVRQPKGVSIGDPFDHVDWEKELPKRMALGPYQGTALQFGDVSFPELRAIQAGILEVHCVAWIKYGDVVGRRPVVHQTQLSRELRIDREGGRAFHYNGTHNCADEDCT